MKTKCILISFALLLTACSNTSKEVSSNNNCETQLKQITDSLNNLNMVLQDNYKTLFPVPSSIESQNLIPLKDYNSTSNTIPVKNERYKVSGAINSKTGKLDLIIPVTENKLRVVNCINVSTPKTNAILLILDGVNGKKTKITPVTAVIKKEFKLKEIGLPDTMEQLYVFVLHDNNVTIQDIASYKKCLKKHPEYNRESECFGVVSFSPLERGGDIVP